MKFSVLEQIVSWLIASMLAVGAWLLMTSFASGANNFPVPVLAENPKVSSKRCNSVLGSEARESITISRVKTDTLAAGNSFRSSVSSVAFLTPTSLATAPRLASSERVPADSNLSAWRNVKTHRDSRQTTEGASRGLSPDNAGSNPAALNSFLDALEHVESGMDARATGDRGKARGSFQFWAVAWSDVSRVRQSRGQSVAHYWCATNRAVARSYASTYLGMLQSYLTTALKRQPTHSELYACWNLGPSGFRRRGFSLKRCPATTQRAAARLTSMLANFNGGAASQDKMLIGASMGPALVRR